MYRYEILEKVEPELWDSNLLKCDYSTFFQTYEYLNSLSADGDSFPIFIQVVDENNNVKAQLGIKIWDSLKSASSGKINSIFNLFSKFGKRGSWVGGPIIHEQENSDRIIILTVLINAMEEIINKYKLIIFDGYSPVQDFQVNDNYLDEFKKSGFEINNFFSFVTDLEQPIEKIWDSIHKSTQRDVKKAERRNIRVKELENFNELEEYFSLNKTWAKTKGMISRDFSSSSKQKYLQSILDGIEKIFLSYDETDLVAGHRLGCFNKIVYSHKVTNSYSKPTSVAGPILTWAAIEWAKKNDFKYYDFSGGEMPPDDPNQIPAYEAKWKNLLNYKRKWGGTEYPYYHFLKITSSKNYKIFKILSKIDFFYREFKRKRFSRPSNKS